MTKDCFVQIACYRDDDIVDTISDLLNKAKNPDSIRIVVGLQDDSDTIYNKIKNLCEIIHIPHSLSNGVCYIRNKLQQYYNNEKYYLQLDSHHRFSYGWDCYLKNGIHTLNKNHKKPIITDYLPNCHISAEGLTVKSKVLYDIRMQNYMYQKIPIFVPYKKKQKAKNNLIKYAF